MAIGYRFAGIALFFSVNGPYQLTSNTNNHIMIAWVLYDIEDDKVRSKVAKLCKQAGLYRVQFSVFLGSIETNQKDTLELQIEELIDEDKDSVYIFPMSKSELKATALLGKAFDKKMITDEVKALFL